jgi:flagellar hook-associated protein 3 FlgL
MRISTAQIYDRGVAGIEQQQSALSRTQQQIASGKRMQTPSDDPVGSAQAVALGQAKDRLGQYSANIDIAKDALGQNDSVLGQISEVLQSVRTLAINGGNSTLNDQDRASLAAEAAGRLQELLGLANTQDGDGHFLFSGYASSTQPFVTGAPGVVAYNGDQGQRALEVAPGRNVPIAFNGSRVFEQVRPGNGGFTALPASGNTGTGVVSTSTVIDPSQLPGDTYRLQFNVSAGVTTYDVLDVTTGTSVSTGNAYTSGSTISLSGMQVALTGAPATGDSFTLAPSGTQSIFQTIQNLVDTLNAPTTGNGAAAARLQNGLNASLTDLDQALDHILTVRADAGATLRELDTLTSGNADRSLQYDTTLSRLTDLDYNQALSDFARQQLALEAAQKSFAQVSSLSLFNYL